MRDDSPTADLVLRARKGDTDAWDALVERFAPLIWSICRRYSLGRADADDVGQYVWLRLVDHLEAIHDPAALPGWLATTTQRECIRALRAARNQHAFGPELDVESIPDEQTGTAEHEVLLAERHAALREAFYRLPPPCQRLIAHAPRRPARAVRRDQRQAGHPHREHRAEPRPLRGEAAPRPGDRRPDRRRRGSRGAQMRRWPVNAFACRARPHGR